MSSMVVVHLLVDPAHAQVSGEQIAAAPVWPILLGVAVLGVLYVLGIRALRRISRRRIPSGSEQPENSRNAELERYARHIVLREIGGAGQARLGKARVLVVGAGGLGSPALMYLAAAGVGTIGIVDDDSVSLSNLQRQVVHFTNDLGVSKVTSARRTIRELNPLVTVLTHSERLDWDRRGIVEDYDLVLDGSDSFETRALVNRLCVTLGKALVFGAVSQWEGQVAVFDASGGTPCYACVFPEKPNPELAQTCADAGIIGALPGVIGSMMAVEAIKFIAGAGKPMTSHMLIYDALWGETRSIKLKRLDNCPVCGSAPTELKS